MRGKKLLATLLLGVGLCFVSVPGHGEVKHWIHEINATYMELRLLDARVNYIMRNPTSFLDVMFFYDTSGEYGPGLPEGIDTKGKIYVLFTDNRDVFSYISGVALLDTFKRELRLVYGYIGMLATDMDTDIVAEFHSREGIPLGYFYQGEYRLWEK